MATEEEFSKAQKRIKTLARTPPPSELLQLYGLFKQATAGDVSGSRPGVLDFKGRAKFDAWAQCKGQNSEAARASYVELVERLLASS